MITNVNSGLILLIVFGKFEIAVAVLAEPKTSLYAAVVICERKFTF